MGKNRFEKEFLRIVASDLHYITKEWDIKIDDDSLRRDCVVLHKLLIEGNLGNAWRAVGFTKEPRILAPVLETIGDRKRADFIQTGGAHYGGIEIRDLEIHSDDSPPNEYAKSGPGIYVEKEPAYKRTKKPLWLTEFLNDTCMIIEGIEISRNDLIVYIANTLGGKHIDWQREFKHQSGRAAKFEALDSVFQTMKTAGKESIYFELLSIVQSLANSRDIHKLIKKIRQTAGC